MLLPPRPPAWAGAFIAGALVLLLATAGTPRPPAGLAAPAAPSVLPERYALVGQWLPPLPDPGPTMYHPEGIDVSPAGLVAVAESGNRLVSVWGLRGDAQGRWSAGGLLQPVDVAFNPAGDRLYVADAGQHRVIVLEAPSGAFRASWEIDGTPSGLATGPDGTVYVSDSVGAQVAVLSPDGTVLDRFGEGPDGGPSALLDPQGLVVSPAGEIVVADGRGQRVVWFAADGTVRRTLDLDDRSSPGGAPHDVGFEPDGDLLVAVDRGVLRFRPDGAFAETIWPLREVPRDGCLPGRCCVDFEPIQGNHEGVRRLATTPGGGLYFTYAPALRWKDRVVARPERWDPMSWPACGTPPARHASDPERVDAGRDPYAHILGSAPALHVFRPDGQPLVPYASVPGGPGNDLAAGGIAGAIVGCRDRARTYTAVATGNQVAFSAVHDDGCAVCPSPGPCCPQPSIDILDPERLAEDPEDIVHWSRAVTFQECGLGLAVLDAGRPQVVVRSYAAPENGGDPETFFLPPMPSGRRLPGPREPMRAYSDLEYAPDGSLWALTRGGVLVPMDRFGRVGDELALPGLADRTAEAIAVQSTRSVFVLTNDGWILKVWTDGTLRAAWSLEEAAGPGRYTDIAVDRDLRLLVVDGANDRVLLFELAADGTSSPPERSGPGCRIEPAKSALPTRLPLGDTTDVTLSIEADCEVPRDIVLVVDGSCQMTGDRMLAARDGGARMLDRLGAADRLAVVTFTDESGGARLRAGLTDERAATREALRTLPTECLPPGLFPGRSQEGRVADGLRAGREALFGADARADARKVLVLVTPSRSAADEARREALWEARQIWDGGAELIAIGMGPDTIARRHASDHGLLAAMSLPADAYRHAPAARDLAAVMAAAAAVDTPEVWFETLEIVDGLPDNMRLVAGSVRPPAEALPDGRLRWTFSDVRPASAPVLRYTVQPLEAGTWPTNTEAQATFVDGLGRAGSVRFPVPVVEVLAPSPTPPPTPAASVTASPTSTPTPTVTARPRTATPTRVAAPTSVFLPIAYRPRCKPSPVPIDVAIVLDTSSSMQGAKMDAAVSAARTFVGVLQLPRDHAAIVSFDRDARVDRPLTGDRGALERALEGLQTGVGTRIDLGLWSAIDEVGGRGRLEADGVIVLLTDGQPQGGTEPDIALAAATARELRITSYAIGLGDGVQPLILEIIAGGPDRVYLAPGPEDLARIYDEIAREIPCR